jgi:hypothetical protein
MPKGDCFFVALNLVVGDVYGNPIHDPKDRGPLPGGKIVHGLPIGRGPENLGERYWHAWVEIVEDGVPTVVDWSNDQRVKMPKAEYYEHGDIQEVWRFNRHQALAQHKKFDHAGPWLKEWWRKGDGHKMSVREATNDEGQVLLIAMDRTGEPRWFQLDEHEAADEWAMRMVEQ